MTLTTDDNKWKALFSLWAFHAFSIFFIGVLNSSSLLRPRAAILIFPLLWLIFSIWMLYQKRIPLQLSPQRRDRFLLLSILLFFIRIILWACEVLFAGDELSRYSSYLQILSPALNLIGYVSFESALLLGYLNLREMKAHDLFPKEFLQKLIIVFVLLASTFAFVSLTRIGLAVTHHGDWGRGQPAVPLLEWQILLACLFCILVAYWEIRSQNTNILRNEIFICIVIYVGAVALWLSQPVIPSASALEPRAPNYEVYPFIDSLTYDEFAQSALAGQGFSDSMIPQRPLYIVFLVFAHVLVGQSYNSVIILQTFLLAFFPVFLYLFGRDLFGRPVGVSIALFAILRDYLMNLVAPITGNASYSKLYLSEIPTAIGMVLFLWLAMRWIRSGFPNFYTFLIGGVLGVSMLIRTQAVAALPILILFALLSSPKSWLKILKHTLFITVMCIVLLIPWLVRNWQMTGQIAFDSPESQTANLALRYGYLAQTDTDISRLPDESNADYSSRLKSMARESITKDPMLAVWGVANSFFNHGVNNILLFPLREKIESVRAIFIPDYPFWQKWEGTPTTSQLYIIITYIFLFGLGIAFAWQRNGWLGLMPLALNLIYNLWTSLALLSGQRFMLTMDWSIYTYFMIGLFVCMGSVFYLFTDTRTQVVKWFYKNRDPEAPPALQVKPASYIFFGLIFFTSGFSLYAVEKIFPQRYPPLPQGQLPAALEQSAAFQQNPAIVACIKDSDFTFTQGRALYPRYYAAGEGETFTDAFGYKRTDQGRIVFSLVGQSAGRIVFPLDESPQFFPHAADVTLIYDNEDLNFIFVQLNNEEYLYPSSGFDSMKCRIK